MRNAKNPRGSIWALVTSVTVQATATNAMVLERSVAPAAMAPVFIDKSSTQIQEVNIVGTPQEDGKRLSLATDAVVADPRRI